MVFTVLGAVAGLERSLIVERVRAGMRNARVKGKRIGRPPLSSFTFHDKFSLPFDNFRIVIGLWRNIH